MFSTNKNLFNLWELKKIPNYDPKKNLCALKECSGDLKKEIMSGWGVQLYLKWNISDKLVTEEEFLNQHLRHERLKRNSL